MDLNRYVEELRHELLVAAEAGGDEARLLAERLVAPLQSATRLMLLDALAAAAGEITSEIAPGSVEVRLRGRDPEFVVALATDPPDAVPTDTPVSPPSGPSGAERPAEGEEGGTSRVTLRLPEPLKARIEEAAGRDGLSVNSWLVRTLAGALESAAPGGRAVRRSVAGGDRFTGWARS